METKKNIEKITLSVEIELLNPEMNYPNYRYNYGSRNEFVEMIEGEIRNIVTPDCGAKIIVKRISQ